MAAQRAARAAGESIALNGTSGQGLTKCVSVEQTKKGYYLGKANAPRGVRQSKCRQGGGCACFEFSKCSGGPDCREVG